MSILVSCSRWQRLLVILLFITSGTTALAQKGQVAPIKGILVEDNTKTTDETVIHLAGIEVGMDFKPEMTEQIRAALVDSGLFREVSVTYKELPRAYTVIISAKDKHSWVVAPTYYNQPTNKGAGLGFGENNLFGENKKVLLYGQLATGDSFFLGVYVDPSIAGSRFEWQADVYLRRERNIEYRPPDEYRDQAVEVRTSKLNYLNVGFKLGARLARSVYLRGRMRGAKVFYDDVALAEGAELADVTDDPAATPDSIPAPGLEGYDVSTELELEYDRLANWYGVAAGSRYNLNFEYALPELGSDFDYWYATMRLLKARKYFSRHNLVARAQVRYGRNLPFQHEFTAGGTDLRGFKNAQYRGDFKAALSLEYSMPLLVVKGVSLRALGFWDSTYTAFVDLESYASPARNYVPGQGTLALAPFKNTVGLGTRIHVRQLVLPLLGIDLGYGIERRAFEVYLAIGLTDL